jgi:5-methylcytosine-specific restriction protein A
LVKTRERDPKLRSSKIEQSRKERGRIACETCGFDFDKVYGELGHGFIHVHHKVGSTSPARQSPRSTTSCVNCHQMIHRHSPWKTREKLKAIISATAQV